MTLYMSAIYTQYNMSAYVCYMFVFYKALCFFYGKE